jgi:hypothetical protein
LKCVRVVFVAVGFCQSCVLIFVFEYVSVVTKRDINYVVDKVCKDSKVVEYLFPHEESLGLSIS